MTSPRRARRLLDPRWHWLLDALHRLYDELDPATDCIGLALTAERGEEVVTYSMTQGGKEIERLLLLDADGFVAAAEPHTVGMTPDPPP